MIRVDNQNEHLALQEFLLDVLNLSCEKSKAIITKEQKEDTFRQANSYLRGILMQRFDQEGRPL